MSIKINDINPKKLNILRPFYQSLHVPFKKSLILHSQSSLANKTKDLAISETIKEGFVDVLDENL